MNKMEYMQVLERQLARLPISDRIELLYEYAAHFTFGLQNGKTEEEISTELGNPYEIAKTVLEDYDDQHATTYRHVPSYGTDNQKRSSSGIWRKTFVSIGLGFLTLALVFPLGVSIWAVWFALSVSSIAFLVSPIMAFLDYILYGEFVLAKWYSVIAFVGVGLILVTGIKHTFIWLSKMTRGYWNWVQLTVKGSHNE